MKALQTIIAVAALLHAADTFAQTEEVEEATSYKAEVFGSASSGSTTPFWMVSNRYGMVPLDANNGYLSNILERDSAGVQGWIWSQPYPVTVMCLSSRYMPSWDIKVCF